jgi:hypothetical protein
MHLFPTNRSQSLFFCILFIAFLATLPTYGQAPTITSFSPAVVTQRTAVTINGTNFTGTTAVRFGGTLATSFTIVSATQITAVVGAGNSGAISVTNASGTGSGGTVTYVTAAATPFSAGITRVISDYNGYWSSTAASIIAANQPNTRHNMTAFGYNGTIYSTGVANSVLTSHSVTYTSGDFRAFPINAITGNTSALTASNYIALGINIDGNASAGNYLAPGVAGLKVRDVLIDGIKGLDLGTGVTNINPSMVLEFSVSNIVSAAITDNEPDIIVTQTAAASSIVDIYCFIDSNGNIVGNPMQSNLSAAPIIGTYRLDLFTLPAITPYSTATPTGNGPTNGTRDIRMIAFKISDFGITAANAPTIAGFKLMPGGDSDPAFIAYNANSFLIPAPVITVQPTSQVVCPNVSGSATFAVTATGAGLSYQWRKDGIDIAGATSPSYIINNVIASNIAAYSVLVSNSAGSVISNTVYLNAIINLQPSPATVCINAGTVLSVDAAGSNLTYQWYSNTVNNNTSGTLISGATSTTYTPPTSSAGVLYYYAAVTANGLSCTAINTVAVAVTVNAASVGGTASGTQVICSGSTATLTLTGSTGNIQWEQSPNGVSGWTNVTAGTGITTATFTTQALSSTVYYRAAVASGVCTTAYSNIITITVNPVSIGGTVSANQVICYNNPVTVSVTGTTGNIQWQESANGISGWINVINGTGGTTANYVTAPLIANIYYRAAVTSGVCATAYSGVVSVTVNPLSAAGTISTDQTVCYSTAATVSVTGSTGNIQWQQSIDGITGWANVTGGTGAQTDSYTTANITGTVWYRAAVKSGMCPEVYSVATMVNTASTTWNGSSWSNGAPINITTAIIAGNFTALTDLDACSLTVSNNAVVNIPSGFNVRLYGALTVTSGNFTLESNANLIQQTAATNSGNIIVKRNTIPLRRLDYVLWAAPITSQNLLAFSPATNQNRFYTYNPATDLYNAIAAPGAENFEVGKGYLIRMPNNHPTWPTAWTGSFNGLPHNGPITVAVGNGLYNAVGNPYPSTIDADAFINANNLAEAVYFWRKTNNSLNTSYATYTLAGGAGTTANTGGDSNLLIPDGIIQVGQGFIVKASSASLSFDNSMRIAGNNAQFFRSNTGRSRIWLNLTNTDGIFSQTMVAYMPGATTGIDAKIDGPYFNDSQMALTSIIDNSEFAIQGRALPFDPADNVPLGFKTTVAGNYTIALDHVDGLFEGDATSIFLKDNTTNVISDLKAGSYAFASEAGIFNTRFEIIYSPLLTVGNPDWNANQIVVYKDKEDIVVNAGKIIVANVKVFDIRGSLLAEKKYEGNAEVTITVRSSHQVLLLQVTSEDGRTFTRKIIN